MTTLFIQPHLGLGDAIICNGLVRALAAKHERIVLACLGRNIPSVSRMLEDLKNLKLHEVAHDDDAGCWANHYQQNGSRSLRLGYHHPDRSTFDPEHWDESFYRQAGVPFDARWEGFRLPELPVVLQPPDGKFAFVQDDQTRGYGIQNLRTTLPTYRPRPTKTILDWIPTIQAATEIHCIDSAFMCLIESLAPKGPTFTFHRYARAGAPPTLRLPWKVLA